jgi:phage shock protein E
MDWRIAILCFIFLVVFFLLKRGKQLPMKDAQQLIKDGAMIIDVRSIGEFQSGHLPKAINIPLDNIEVEIPRRVKGKNAPLLLHCQSGMRSGAAMKKLQALGYTNVHNLGSYNRAQALIENQ